jgi:sugar phosphate isomerase/epimerase
MIEQAGSERIGICLDTANSLGAGEGLETVLDQLGPLTVNLHVKDFAITRVPSAMGFLVEGRPAGEGLLDLPALLKTLRRHGRCRSAVLETWTPRPTEIRAAIRLERRWTLRGLANLRPLFPAV